MFYNHAKLSKYKTVDPDFLDDVPFYNHTKLSRYKTSNSLFIPFIWSYRVVIRHCSIKTKCCYLIPSILGHKIALTSNDV